MGNYNKSSLGASLIPHSEDMIGSAVDHAVKMILRTRATVAISEDIVASSGKAQQRIYRSVRELRRINEDILRAIKDTQELLCAPHNIETWDGAFARMEVRRSPGNPEQSASSVQGLRNKLST